LSELAAPAQRSVASHEIEDSVMKQAKYILIVIIVSISAASSATSQLRTNSPKEKTGKIQGVLLDVNDARITGARILIENASLKRELRSASEGDFQIQLPAGSYQIKVQANGFRKFELSPFKVKANVAEMINIHIFCYC
jgi:hypothetical protein